MDDGSSESGEVREDECVDVDDDGEVDEERTSASVAQEYQHFVGKKLGQHTLLLGEYKCKQYGKKRGYGGVSIEDIGIAGSPEEYKVSAQHEDQHLDNRIYRGIKINISLLFYGKEKGKLDSGNEVENSVNREAVGHVCDNSLIVDCPVYDKYHRCLEKDGKQQHDPQSISILDPVENAVDKRKYDIQDKDGGQIPCDAV